MYTNMMNGGAPATTSAGGIQWVFNVGAFPYTAKVGQSVSMFQVGPCSAVLPHVHPRSGEFVTVISGRLNVSFVEENGGRVLNYDLGPYDAFPIPRGVPHGAHNPNCEPAMYLAYYDAADPGTITLGQALAKLPTITFAAALNITEALGAAIQSHLVTAKIIFEPASDNSCVQTCISQGKLPAGYGWTPTGSTDPIGKKDVAA